MVLVHLDEPASRRSEAGITPLAVKLPNSRLYGQVTRSASVGTFAGDSLLGKSVNQKLTDQFESLVGS
jgi:hypothetical protein